MQCQTCLNLIENKIKQLQALLRLMDTGLVPQRIHLAMDRRNSAVKRQDWGYEEAY